MRWIVEVSSLGKTDLQKFCVEAESWQRALQAARAQRGEEGPMSGFSIELLEEGYRAVDPVARVRFVVKRAPDDMPITAPLAKDAKTGVAPSPPSTTLPATAGAEAKPTTISSPPPASKSGPPRPGDKATNGPISSKGPALAAAETKAPITTSATMAAAAATTPAATSAVMPASAPASTPAPVGSALPGLPPLKVLSSREQDPTDASPLTYREYSFVVPAGTSEDIAVEVLRGQLKLVDAQLASAKMGKLVNLAVFDVEFTGKPPAPVATLTWKDWKGAPVIGYPRRGAAQKQVKPPSTPPPAPQGATAPGVFPAPSTASNRPPAPGASQPPGPIVGAHSAFPGAPSSFPPPALVSPTPVMPQAQSVPAMPASVPPPANASVPPPANASAPPPANASPP
ncbi:MAG TPA: hypothetical protein VM925_23460, partial [Labilithrix sp.]|nr:hypothetical protein [Labilithrix sp.]